MTKKTTLKPVDVGIHTHTHSLGETYVIDWLTVTRFDQAGRHLSVVELVDLAIGCADKELSNTKPQLLLPLQVTDTTAW